MFIQPDEYMLIMDLNEDDPLIELTQDQLYALADCGVKTIYRHAAIRWDLMQPSPDAPLNWDNLDAYVERARRAGLKSLIPFMYSFPRWVPDEYLYSKVYVPCAYGVPNYQSAELAAVLDEFIIEAVDRYASDDCQVIYALPACGEFAFSIVPDNAATPIDMQTLVDWVVARQRIFHAQHNEIWTAYHPYTNPSYWFPIYDALFKEFSSAHHYGITFTYVQHGAPHIRTLLRDNQERGMIYYGGTEYIEGLRPNVKTLRSNNMRMITGPKHPYQARRKIDAFAQDEIRWAIGEYANA